MRKKKYQKTGKNRVGVGDWIVWDWGVGVGVNFGFFRFSRFSGCFISFFKLTLYLFIYFISMLVFIGLELR